jgi:hypothetical protein
VLMRAECEARAPAFVLITACVMAIASCGSSPQPPSPTDSPACRGGQYCVNVDVTGQVSGRLATAMPPGNFRVICTVLPKPNPAWVAHVFGTLQGGTWLLVVQAGKYTAPASYSAIVTLGKLASGSAGTTTSADYVGDGTVVVGSGGTSASMTANLRAQQGAGKAIHVGGTISCDKLAIQN